MIKLSILVVFFFFKLLYKIHTDATLDSNGILSFDNLFGYPVPSTF